MAGSRDHAITLRLTLVLWLFIRGIVSIVAFFVMGIILDIAQVLVILLCVGLDNGSINTGYKSVRRLTLLALYSTENLS